MKCNACGAQNPEGMRYCGTCGNDLGAGQGADRRSEGPELPPPPEPAGERRWGRIAATLFVIVLMVLAGSLIFVQNWSKVVVFINNDEYSERYVAIYIDGKLGSATTVTDTDHNANDLDVIVEFFLSPGTHTVAIDIVYTDEPPVVLDLENSSDVTDIELYKTVRLSPLETEEIWYRFVAP